MKNYTSKFLLVAAMMMVWIGSSIGQCLGVSMICNTDLQITLNGPDQNCEFVVTPDVVLKAPQFPDNAYSIVITDEDGDVVPNATLTEDHIGQRVSIEITHIACNLACWGYADVEDKADPQKGTTSGTSVFSGSGTSWDNASTGLVNEIMIDASSLPAGAMITDVNVAIQVDHSNIGNLTIAIENPNGVVQNLVNAPCGNVSNINATFDADSPNVLSCGVYDVGQSAIVGCPNPPASNSGTAISGTLQPSGNFTFLNAGNPAGDWILSITDNATNNGGCLQSYTLTLGWEYGDGPLEIACNDNSLPQSASEPDGVFPVVFEDCSDLFVSYEDVVSELTCSGSIAQEIFRNWIATDAHGNTTTCTQIIRVRRGDLSGVTFPQSYSYDCDDAIAMNANFPDPDFLVSQNLEGYPGGTSCPNVIFNYTDSRIELCGVGYKIVRSWLVVDWCTGDQTFGNQVIKVEDNDAPIVTCPVDAAGQGALGYSVASYIPADNHCEGTWVNVPAPTVTTECSGYTWTIAYLLADEDGNPPPQNTPYITDNVVITGYNGDQPIFNITNLPFGDTWVKYTITDECNLSSDCYTEVNVYDASVPTAICEGGTVLTLNDENCQTIFATSLDDGSWDNCSDQLEFGISLTNGNFQESLDFCCAHVGTNLVYLQVKDEAGNASICTGNVVVEDAVTPYITSCVADKTVGCGESTAPSNTGSLTSSNVGGNCTNPSITHSDGPFLNQNCGTGYFDRTWLVTGSNGLSTSCVQRITVIADDPLSSGDIIWPSANIDLPGCVSNQNITPDVIGSSPTVNNSSDCVDVAISYEDETIGGSSNPNYCLSIKRTWKVTDWCLYDPNSPIQYYEFEQILNIQGGGAPVFQSCNTITISDGVDDCQGEIDITQIATDDCSVTLVYNWTLDLHSNGSVDDQGSGNTISDTYPSGTHKATFFAVDDCGNEGMTMCTIIIDDEKAPTPICIAEVVWGLDSNGETEVWASDFDLKSEDTCDPTDMLTFSFTADGNTPSMSFNCDSIPNGIGVEIPLEMHVIDTDGNSEFCLVTLILQDNADVCMDQGTIAGRINGNVRNEMGEEVENVEVELMNITDNVMLMEMTNQTGDYAFSTVDFYDGYSIDPTKNSDPLNGVSTLDLVLIQKHILNITPLDSPYKLIAADINNSSNISATDLIELRKLILGIYTSFPDNDPFVFVVEDHEFSDPAQPWNYENNIDINALYVDENDADFIAVKVGDVNNTAVYNANSDASNRSIAEIDLSITDQKFKAGDIVSVEMNLNDLTEIHGYQMEFSTNNVLKLLSVNANDYDLTGLNHRQLDNGDVRISWHAIASANIEQSLVVFQFEALAKGQLSEVIAIDNKHMQSEIYDEDLNTFDIALAFENVTTAEFDFALYQNSPNPFSAVTNVQFKSDMSQEFELSIIDINGKLIKTISKTADRGLNSVKITNDDLSVNGIYYYQLTLGEYTATKKMILLK